MRKKALSWILTVAMVLSFVVTMPITASAVENSCRIVDTGVQYATLDEALSAATSGQTIQLLTDITSEAMIAAYTKSFTLDVNGHTLTVNVLNGTCLYAGNEYDLSITDSGTGGSVVLTTSGVSVAGLYALGYGSEIHVDVPTSVNVTGTGCYGIYATEGGVVSVTGDITATGTNCYGAGVFSDVYGSLITIDGDIDATNYINANGDVYAGPEQCVLPTTKSGYLTFMDTGDSANPQSTVWVKEVTYVCEVDGVQYETLDEAITAAAVDWDTIMLLADIDYSGGLSPTFDMYFDLNGYTLNINNEDGIGLHADGYDLDIFGEGELNVTGTSVGVWASGACSVEVTNAVATGASGYAVFVLSPSSAIVYGNATANGTDSVGVMCTGTTTVHGDISAMGTGGIGVWSQSTGTVTVNGDITATNYIKNTDTMKTQGDITGDEDGYFIYTEPSYHDTVKVKHTVCAIGATEYKWLDDALDAAESGDTITLLDDIDYAGELELTDISLTFDLDTYSLNLGKIDSQPALLVDNAHVDIIDDDGGSLNIIDGYYGVQAKNGGTATVSSISNVDYCGVRADDEGSFVWVNENISALGYNAQGFYIYRGAGLHVCGDVESRYSNMSQVDATVTVDGNVSSISDRALLASVRGSITVSGNVTSQYQGPQGYNDGYIHIMGDATVTGTGDNAYGAYAYLGADIVIDGDVQSTKGLYATGEGSTVTVGGNTKSTGADEHGAYALSGALITVDGTISASNYVFVGDTTMTEDSFTINGNGYYLYTDSTSSVMVKINTCLIDGCSTSLEDGGFTQYSVIDGETYYHVTNAAQLAHINSHLDQNYIQMNDIDLTGIDWTPIGSRFYPDFELGFDGIFDGNGYLISNLTIGSDSTPKTGGNQTQAGLFGAIKYNAILKNIRVTVDIHTDGVTNVGGLVGYSEADGTVSNCSADGSISIKGEDTNEVGGLIGYVSNTSISECSSNVTITVEDYANKVGGLIGSHGRYSYNKLGNISNSIFTGAVNGGNSSYTGGITGTSYGNVFIINSINAGSVTAARGNVGGIAGQIHNNIANCYNIGSVSHSEASSDKIGGIVAYIDGGYVKNCYNAGTVSTPGSAIAGAVVAVVGQYDTAANLYSDETVNPGLDPVNRIDENGTTAYLYNLTTEEMKGAAPSQPLEYGEGLTASEILSALNGWIDEFNYSEADITFAQWDMDSSLNSGYPYLVGVPMENNAELDSLSITEGTLSPSFSKDIDVYEANVPNSTDELSVTAIARSENASISINGETVSTSIVQLAVGNNTIEIIVTAENGITTNRYTVNITRAAASSSGGGSSAPTGQQITVSTPDGETVVTGTLTESASTEQVTIGGTQFRKLADTNQGAMIPAPSATVTFDAKAMDAINGASSTGDVILKIKKLDSSTLTPEQQKRVGDRPVYDFTLTKGGRKITRFDGGHAKISIPYTLQTGENPHQVVIYYLTSNGTLKPVRGHYDAESECVVFETTHFSTYAVGYNPVSFSDVASDAWYKDAVDFIAAREITSGTGDGAFSPEVKLTRGQFIVLLMNAYGISSDAAEEGTTNFVDAGNTYYTNYLLAAKSLGIVNGVGNNMFAPEQAITRQEMFVMLYNALSVLGELPAASGTKLLSDFEDASQIASWAQEATDVLVKGGVISGSNGMLNPDASTTRAEMSQMLYNLLSK